MALLRHSTPLAIIPGLSLLAISLCEVNQIVPLSKGGRDEPSNMQWLPKAQRQDRTRGDLRP